MREVDMNLRLRNLCQRMAGEEDPEQVKKLAGELRSVVDTEQDEARLRLRYVVSRYRDRVRAMASQRTDSERGLQLRALIAFLGIGSNMSGGGQTQN